jgi:hypothetical protein
MKRAIVTTTINAPTEALKQFEKVAKADDWHLFIVGDQKTPHFAYAEMGKFEHVTYLHPHDQEEISQELSDLIGWNCIQRRNFGFIAAHRWGAEVIATIDDDNIPYTHWGRNVVVGQDIYVDVFSTKAEVFDPLYVCFPKLWHRGFPIQLLDQRSLSTPCKGKRKVLVQADFWDEDPDVDAVERIALAPSVLFQPGMESFTSNKPGPFNSQNTFLSREVFPHYFLFPGIGRMDDIWASYVTQYFYPDSVVYAKASVHQVRNPHDLSKDLEAEMIGYRHTLDFVRWLYDSKLPMETDDETIKWPEYMPPNAIAAYNTYRRLLEDK